MKRINVLSALLLLVLAAPPAARAADPGPCDLPEAHQFDFWVGSWEVHAQGRVVGHNRISRILGGCTLLEEYDTSPRPYAGKSFNWYDPTDGRWHQVWVDNGGLRLHLTGGLADGAMVLAGERVQDGAPVTDRITWTAAADGTVRQHWETSGDGGATWATAFDGLYRPLAADGEAR